MNKKGLNVCQSKWNVICQPKKALLSVHVNGTYYLPTKKGFYACQSKCNMLSTNLKGP